MGLLLAAALTVLGLLGATVVGAGLVHLPSVVPSPLATPSATPTATASTSPDGGIMLGTHFGHTASLLPDGRVLVAGGGDDYGAEVYDPDRRTWTATADMVALRHGHSATVLRDGTVLVVGGAETDGPAFTSAEIYEPVQDTWTATGSMVSPRAHHTANLLADGRVLVAGGKAQGTGGAALAAVEIYDPATGLWTSTGDMNESRGGHTATLLDDGTLLVAGGTDEKSAPAELYDPARGTWSYTGSMMVNRAGHSAQLLADGRVLVVGGMAILGPRSSTDTGVAELYDPATGGWTTTSPQLLTVNLATLVMLRNGMVLASEGSAVDLWDPATGEWTAAPSLRSPANWFGYSATLLGDGTVLMAGGWEPRDAGVGPPSLWERYTPPSASAPNTTNRPSESPTPPGRQP